MAVLLQLLLRSLSIRRFLNTEFMAKYYFMVMSWKYLCCSYEGTERFAAVTSQLLLQKCLVSCVSTVAA